MIIEMDVLRMLARKVGNLHEERSVPLWQSAAVQVIQQGAVYILISNWNDRSDCHRHYSHYVLDVSEKRRTHGMKTSSTAVTAGK